ncbi:SDR family oxidoreductase [Geminicoccaceae bacterium 1502E]|nr:SDR family oxidoreductase [Geminicoccaceae bacterium 1502E]
MGKSRPTALVTGGASGIGRAVAERLARDGLAVTITDIDAGQGERTAAVLAAAGTVRFVQGDAASEPDMAAALRQAAGPDGGLNALVCNAGIMIRKPLTDLSLEEWRRVIDTNLTSSFLLARHAAPLLRKAGGAIVTIASTRAHQSEPDTEAYAASKGGLVALTHALAVSLGPEVRANCISPGWIDTSGEPLDAQDHAQHPAGRVGRPEDVAALASWLVGPESGFVTGAEFVVDGGMTRKMIYV